MLSSIENYYERLVAEHIRDTLKDMHEAHDEEFVEDLACIALNALPSRYVRHSIDLSSHLADTDRESMQQEVAAAVTCALQTIRRRRDSRETD